eukprot:6984344-Ditylum_brightwellii.AAC.1
MNRPILVLSQILQNIMPSTAEAELGAIFENAKEAVVLSTTLNKSGHQQQATPIQVDNSTAHKIVNINICQHKSKAIDMHFYWVKIELSRDNLKFIGSQLEIIKRIVSSNITHWLIIK